MSSAINASALGAVWRRQLGSLLGNPLGYLFILFFVLASAGILFLPNGWFQRNIADLGPLLSYEGVPLLPVLLVLLVPALAMGAWAQERESGTEELLLTLPMSLLDAVLGKYLAVVTYATIALLCSLSNVIILDHIAAPDYGLLFANYLGWWLAALVFAAWGLLASVLVAMPAIAFVLGALFCGALMYGAYLIDFFDPSNRGLFSFAQWITALCGAGVGISLALMTLAGRRWRAGREERIVFQILALLFAIGLAINLTRIGERFGVDRDLSRDGLSSLAPESARILEGLGRDVRIAVFISDPTPENLLAKRKEIEERAKAIERRSGGRVRVEWHYPQDTVDQHALIATQSYNLKTRREVVETVSGREPVEVFLGAAVTSGGRTQVIDYFDPGLSVEYELMRAVRAVSAEKKRILGIATTDLEIGSGFDFRAQSMRPAWQVYEEWKKLYEVRDVVLDAPVAPEIDALVVPQPSSLTEPQIKNLHDYIWAGRPAMLMEDPLPVTVGPQLNAGEPKKQANNPYGMPEEGGPAKGKLQPLLAALGIDIPNQVMWSDYNPSHAHRGALPPNMVWIPRWDNGEKGDSARATFADSTITRGFEAMLLPWPGRIDVIANKPKDITVTPLIRPVPTARFGQHDFNAHVERGWGGLQPKQSPGRYTPSVAEAPPVLAVHIRGTMPSAYPKPDPARPKVATPVVDAKEDAAKPEGEAKPEEAKPAETQFEERVGVPSAKPVNVVVVADVDFAHDFIYGFYRNQGGNYSRDDLVFLKDLRNVQFAMNAVDELIGENELVAVRNKIPRLRKLDALEEAFARTQAARNASIETAQKKAEDSFEEAKAKLEREVQAIEAREDLDEFTKANLIESRRRVGQTKVEATNNQANRELQQAIERAKSDQRSEIIAVRSWIRVAALAIPSVILSALALVLLLRRVIRERTNIPAARARSHA